MTDEARKIECQCVTRWSGTERETDRSECPIHTEEMLRILALSELHRECAAALARKDQEIAEVREEGRLEGNVPVKYYQEGGIVYAVYGTSSIDYTERLRAEIASLKTALKDWLDHAGDHSCGVCHDLRDRGAVLATLPEGAR